MPKALRAVAIAAVPALILSACANNDKKDDAKPSAGTKQATITFAWEQEFQSYNNNTAAQNATANAVVLNQVLRGFWYYDNEGQIIPDKEFGSYEKLSDNPLKIKYTFSDKAVWSDGNPIDCDDAVLAWVANSAQYKTGKKDDEGNDILVFSTAGSTGYDLQQVPECNDGDKTFTVTFNSVFADWQGLYGATAIMPAHIVESKSGVSDIIAAVKNKDEAALSKAGTFYNDGWVFKKGEFLKDISPSAGPYMIDSWQGGQSVTLAVNPKWWGTPPKVAKVVIRTITQDQQALALQNGEIDAMDPQPNPELLQQLQSIGSSVQVKGYDQYTWEHFDFNFRKGNPFTDRDLREAFTKCLPRQRIVDNLIKPQNPNAKILQSRYFLPFQAEYPDVAPAIIDSKYDAVDIPGAKAILDRKGKAGLTVRVGYKTPNPRRTSEVELLRDSCGQAGFKIVDAGTADFFGNGLANGNFDVALYAWSGSPLISGSSSTYVTNGGNNNGKYSNPQVDTLTAQLNGELDRAKQVDLIKQIEKILWDDLATVPVFAFPAVAAWNSKVEKVIPNASQSGLTWNMQEWNKS
ncbi:MAG: ABC transporter family substrate-binding protein [Kineosporiaceae bacterium]